MNKYQAALEFLRSEDVTAWGNDKLEILYFHLDNIEELVEKATPKKPIGNFNSVPHYRCPNCKCTVKLYKDSHKYKCCLYCGQVIDWSDEDVE